MRKKLFKLHCHYVYIQYSHYNPQIYSLFLSKGCDIENCSWKTKMKLFCASTNAKIHLDSSLSNENYLFSLHFYSIFIWHKSTRGMKASGNEIICTWDHENVFLWSHNIRWLSEMHYFSSSLFKSNLTSEIYHSHMEISKLKRFLISFLKIFSFLSCFFSFFLLLKSSVVNYSICKN